MHFYLIVDSQHVRLKKRLVVIMFRAQAAIYGGGYLRLSWIPYYYLNKYEVHFYS